MSKLVTEYLNFKKSHTDSLLFYRLGGFYELYFDDAILVAKELGIVLNYKKISNQQIATCGFPVKSLAVFSNRLLQVGFKIVIAEQFIDPQNPQQITRKINKILTAGTFVDDQFLFEQENVIVAIVPKNNLVDLCQVDLCQVDLCQVDLCQVDLCFGNVLLGEFYVDEIELGQINQYLEAIKPVEILLEDKEIIDEKFHSLITFYQPNSNFKLDGKSFKTLSKYHNLALRNIFSYVDLIHNFHICNYFKIWQYQNPQHLKIDAKTIDNLELRKIIPMIDKANCQIGKRFLQSAILKPWADTRKIKDRLDGVEFLIERGDFLKRLKNDLRNLPDLEKLIGRIVVNKSANINDLFLVLQGLQLMVKISEFLFWQNNSKKLPRIFREIYKELFADFTLLGLLNSALQDGFVKVGFSAKLDHFVDLQQEILRKINQLEIEYQHSSGVKNLRIESSSLLGFYFEIRRDKASKIKIPDQWQLLQNLNNSIRFSSAKLKNYQLEKVDLEIKIKAIEAEILQDLTKKVIQRFKEIKDSCKAIGLLDLLVSFAVLAQENNYVKPIITNKNKIEIIAGRHLVDKKFVANDCILGKQKIYLITGENMAGKSTFLRQNALIVLLAQAGCFVPANYAEIGVRKEVFSKMVVNDNWSQNQSSFMVEMLEMAKILKNANENSLIIIDELCQTTNAVEGEKIAFGIIKYLLGNNKSLALITTHQPNLANQLQDFQNIICQKINKNHRIEKGVARFSSAIAIAQDAGLPKEIFIE